MTPRATYRFQFNRDFPFERAEALVPYLDGLGVSHVYASPITTAASGSMHGYDVVDPTRVNPELGGEDGLRSLVGALRRHGMGLVIDIVPNHMGVAGGENAWWNDVLRLGQGSRHARFFDIDWREKVLLPILGAPLDEVIAQGQVFVDRAGADPALVVYGQHRLPLAPGSRLPSPEHRKGLHELLAQQHYRLGWWRTANDELNWRRFFTINELAGLRVEDPQVFEETHALYFRLWREGLIDGVRIDHVDGLTDPAAYCRKLRERLAESERPADAPEGPAYIVVEKILGPGEALPTDWGVDGTSGYDFMEELSLLLHDPGGEDVLADLWTRFSGRPADFAAEELAARRDMLAWAFEAQLTACVAAFRALAATDAATRGFTHGMLRRAISRLLDAFPVYRTYGTGDDAPASDSDVREAARRKAAPFTPPGEEVVSDAILNWLAGKGPGDAALAADAVCRFQQLSAPIAAKAVEDTAFYRHGKLLSRTDVGFDAAHLACPPERFHRVCDRRARDFPGSMLATATHDHKRGEDVRARLAVLSSIPEVWRERVLRWDEMASEPDVDPADRYMLYQMLFGAWPDGLVAGDRDGLAAYGQRLAAWQEKALREAKLRSSWEQPDEPYETRCRSFATRLCDPAQSADLLADIAAFLGETAAATEANMLVQTGLHFTVPGMPDIYQGCELPDFSMVDPDNRRPVDYAVRDAMLAQERAEHPKLALIRYLLTLRRAGPELFAGGSYEPATVGGARAGNVLGFTRSLDDAELQCAFAIRCGAALLGGTAPAPTADWWRDTTVSFGGRAEPVAGLFDAGPVSVRISRR